MENKSTHFIFDGNKIVISPDIHSIIGFLQEIEKEIESFLGFDKKLESIKRQHLETIKLIEVLAKKLKDNLIDFHFVFSEKPESIADKLKMDHPIRSKMIILFAYLETLLRLNFAYENKINDGDKIRKLTLDQKVWEAFYNDFCLNEKNKWVKENEERSKYITAHELRYLRNSLTHFFSVDKGLGVADALLDEKSRKLEEQTSFKAKFISAEDLYEIIKGTAKLMIEKWSRECQACLKTKSSEFKEKILSVNKLIYNSGVVIVKNEQINL